MQYRQTGFVMYELMLAITLLVFIVSLQVPLVTFWQETTAWFETMRLAQAIRSTSMYAVATGINQMITIDTDLNTYQGPLDGHKLTENIHFQAPTEALGPPSSPYSPITKPITFINNQIHLFSSGIISGGSIYLKHKSAQTGYAICNGINLISRLRIYHFNQTWNPL